ncbi:Domain of unknown function DUF1828 [Methanolacinia petrolearia DSM 11571]|uniref:DUF1828 domain-containing protein n=1 Tax=Methanolacinia petrolearia (strain DSM 11571 / OCM 486 / SEBR 4847) TaxID=679926 RepID=E1RG57_METP4|nr:DUF1828 domain-containing protein [Methanolacinia petrolearia]ADN36292.1 Domain of unknown function DUF1828 [Methanolacinia petrolearia DSM 11571]
MTEEQILKSFKSVVCSDIRIVEEGLNRFHVFTPFRFNDGDRYLIILKKKQSRWVLSDEGHTFMHLSYKLDMEALSEGTRFDIVNSAKEEFSVNEDDGELYVEIPDEEYGHSLFNLIQAISKIYDTSFLSRDRVKTTFIEDLKETIQGFIPKESISYNWHHPTLDTDAKYPVDYRIDGGSVPIFIFALNSDKKIDDATITILWHEKMKIKFYSIGIYEKQESNNRKSVARLTDVCDRSFSSLPDNISRIEKIFSEQIPQLSVASTE